MAVFYRTNAQSRSFEEALRRSGIPYKIVGRDALLRAQGDQGRRGLPRLSLNPADATALARAQRPAARDRQDSQEALAQFAREGT